MVSRNAPSVSYPVGRSHVERALLQGWTCVSLALMAGLAWTLWTTNSFSGVAGLAVVTLLSGALRWAWVGWHSGLTGWLIWAPDAQTAPFEHNERPDPGLGWWWSGSEEGGVGLPVAHLRVTLLFPRWALVHMQLLTAGRPRHWVWLESSALPDRWLDLRRALVSHAG